ncbi:MULTISPECIES: hypothetical protein [Alphaproteobacteria]|uniref:Uncharacterized protein n=2 Tax=Alphaproteobacteria TaxID=28211 RepID=A0A512HFN8_9HYPH|nr:MULTISPECIES: hypothetical protein [Alphaproteobacteria]GEO84251.1 hypothetical protein RNA01_11830 [Ciceribacter naphthalenivorans]GLR24787.1 hypothetical protein GCM10007920_45810 [Ciceribacter naphthalenivorans]GLT07643.1 hypothetical protein GCM10007926_45810 [Sphingomonas psychrolutea]
MTATKDTFFKPGKVEAHDKASTTDHTARAIIAAEVTARDKKTEMLKALRMQREAEAPSEAEAKPAKRTTKKATTKSV